MQLTVTEDIKVGETVVIAHGANVTGRVVQAVPKRRMGRTGKLDFSVERVTAIDNSTVPLRYTVNKKEGGSHAVSTGILTAGVAVVFWPAAPFFLLRHDKEAKIGKGMVFDVFTDQEHGLGSSTKAAITAAPGAPATVSQQDSANAEDATLTITSEPTGADIEIDGAFVGNTPSTLKLPKGPRKIVIKKGELVWQRDIDLRPGSSITINGTLEKP